MKCQHCGENTKNSAEKFCCLGCSTAYKIINKLGFENYYKLREENFSAGKIKPELTEKLDISEFVLREKDGTNSVSLMVQGMHCAACIWLIESILKKQKDVLSARINLTKKTLFLHWIGDPQTGNDLIQLIQEIGYKLLPFDTETLNSTEKKWSKFLV